HLGRSRTEEPVNPSPWAVRLSPPSASLLVVAVYIFLLCVCLCVCVCVCCVGVVVCVCVLVCGCVWGVRIACDSTLSPSCRGSMEAIVRAGRVISGVHLKHPCFLAYFSFRLSVDVSSTR